MAKVFTKNVGYSSTVGAIFALKAALVAAGWVVTASSDGTTYNASGDQITDATKLSASRAWFVIQDPNGRAWCFQRTTNDANWRIKYATADGFAAGTPSATVTPAATTSAEEVIMIGSGTDASPSGGILGATTGSYIAQICCDNAAPYGFWIAAYSQGTGLHEWMIFQDPLVSGSYNVGDTDPIVVCLSDGVSASSFPTSSSSGAKAWLRRASGSGAVVSVSFMSGVGWGSNNTLFPEGAGTDPESGDDIALPLIWGRSPVLGAPSGWKGVSSLFEISGAARNCGDTLERVTPHDHIFVFDGAFIAEWDGTVPTV